jgi:hypothetical protein
VCARYHSAMKRSPRKLVVHRETLRALAGLDQVRIAGGEDGERVDSAGAGTGCPKVALDTGGAPAGCPNVGTLAKP